MPEEEMPPEWMWHLDHELVPWFEEVQRKRDEKYAPDKNTDDDGGGNPMMSNELAAGMKRR